MRVLFFRVGGFSGCLAFWLLWFLRELLFQLAFRMLYIPCSSQAWLWLFASVAFPVGFCPYPQHHQFRVVFLSIQLYMYMFMFF